MNLQELVLCTTVPATPGAGAISLHDIQTGSTLATFKQTSAGRNCTAMLPTRDGQGGFMLAAQSDRSIMNVYHFQKDQLALKIVLPEKLSCIAVDQSGDYCAGGTSEGRIYLWEVPSGIMFNAWDAHYRRVNVLRFAPDSAALISGSEDSSVNVWSMSRLLDNDLQNELVTPHCSLTDHTLSVTDLVCGVGPFPKCRLLTASIDHTVKHWDLATGTLLTTFQFPRAVAQIAWDVTERLFFAGADDGSIYQVNLFQQREDKFGKSVEAVGGAGVSDIIHVEQEEPTKKRLITVGQPITVLALSFTTSLLLVGTADGHIHMYDIASHQLVRSISSHKGMTITHIRTLLKPPDLVGHVSLSLGAGHSADMKETFPVKPVTPFQRMRDPKTRGAHEVSILLPADPSRPVASFFSYPMEELIQDQAFFVGSGGGSTKNSGVVLEARVGELESEVAKLRSQLAKAKSINDAMWGAMVQGVVLEGQREGGSDENGGTSEEEDEDSSRRKRGRS